MPYYPKPEEELTYLCPGCKKTYRRGMMTCLVRHPPGTCCHYYEIEVRGEE